MSAPMLPPAPGRLSTITCWPSAALIGAAMRRAIVSPPPPAEDPTMMRIGLVGYDWGYAGFTLEKAAAVAQIAALSLQNGIDIAEGRETADCTSAPVLDPALEDVTKRAAPVRMCGIGYSKY